MSDDGIIGLDFCSLFGAMLDPKNGMMRISNPYNVKAQCVLRTISSVASVVQTVKIPPGFTCDVLCSSIRTWKKDLAVFEPDLTKLSDSGLDSADTLVGNAGWAVIPISNPGPKMVYLEKGTEVGKMTLASTVVNDIIDRVSTEKPIKELREDLESY